MLRNIFHSLVAFALRGSGSAAVALAAASGSRLVSITASGLLSALLSTFTTCDTEEVLRWVLSSFASGYPLQRDIHICIHQILTGSFSCEVEGVGLLRVSAEGIKWTASSIDGCWEFLLSIAFWYLQKHGRYYFSNYEKKNVNVAGRTLNSCGLLFLLWCTFRIIC